MEASNDEVGQLVEGFNETLAEIRERDRGSMRTARPRNKVEERTHDLQVAKEAAEAANMPSRNSWRP